MPPADPLCSQNPGGGQGRPPPFRGERTVDATNAPNPPSAAPRPETLFGCFCRRLFLALGLGALLAAGSAAGVWVGTPGPKHTVRTRLRNPPGDPLLHGV